MRYRVYRPAVVVGDSVTGEMDKVDGPYYFFAILAGVACCPRSPRCPARHRPHEHVSVDYVVDALVALIHVA